MAEWKVVKSVIRSARALSYEEADAAIEDSSHPMYAELDALNRVAASLRRGPRLEGRAAAGPRRAFGEGRMPTASISVRMSSRAQRPRAALSKST